MIDELICGIWTFVVVDVVGIVFCSQGMWALLFSTIIVAPSQKSFQILEYLVQTY